jgi:hypothetical protein
MPSLDDFLNSNSKIEKFLDLVEGSFACQNSECKDVTSEGFYDAANNRIKWTCVNGHDSSVKI